MKRIKYITSFFIIFIGMLIIGESHIFYVSNFYNSFYTTTLYLQNGTKPEEMINDIVSTAMRNKVDVFAYTGSYNSTLYNEINIYGTPGAEEYIKANKKINQQEYTSLFCGAVNLKYNSIKDLPGVENVHDFFLIGNKEDIRQFKKDLVNVYAGNLPKEGHTDKSLTNNIMFIWLLITITILLLSFYDVVLQKKENLIKISMGEKLSNIIWKNIALDSFVLVLFFIMILFSLSKVTYVYFNFTISLLCFLTLLCLNALVFFNLYLYNLKEVFSNTKIPGRLLVLNYIIKVITVILTIFIISSNITMIFESYNIYKQKSFFEQYRDYFYTQISYKPIINIDGSIVTNTDRTAIATETFYRDFFEKFDATLLTQVFDTEGNKTVLANKNAFEYLSSEIKELRNITLNKDIYFLLPPKLLGNAAIIDMLNETIKYYEGEDFNYSYDIIYYNDRADIIAIDNLKPVGSEFLKNPVIIYNNIQADKSYNEIDIRGIKEDYTDDIMYKISDAEFESFIIKHGLVNESHTKINVFENYENKWRISRTILLMNSIFSILFLLLEFIVISTVIKLEYQVNAIELSIKKIMGYSIFEKNSKLIILTAVPTVVSIISAVIIAGIIGLKTIYYLAYGGIFILLLELFVIAFYINKIEKTKIQKILKGGNL